jgi:hypothetical protein
MGKEQCQPTQEEAESRMSGLEQRASLAREFLATHIVDNLSVVDEEGSSQLHITGTVDGHKIYTDAYGVGTIDNVDISKSEEGKKKMAMLFDILMDVSRKDINESVSRNEISVKAKEQNAEDVLNRLLKSVE